MASVSPGDVITADMMNTVLSDIEDIRSQLPDPSLIEVPSFLGLRLQQVRQVLNQPSTPFSFGSVYDAFGQTISPASPAFDSRRVISQAPPGGSRAAVDSALSFIVSADPGSTQPQPSPPQITRLRGIVNGVLMEGEVEIGGQLNIEGDDFASPASANVVTIDGTAAAPLAGPSGPPRLLVVTVPSSLSPPAAGQTRPVQVVVHNGVEPRATATLNLHAAPASRPIISAIQPAVATPGSSVTITGSGFVGAAQNIRVYFGNETDPEGNVLATPTSKPDDVHLLVEVPTGIPGVSNLPSGETLGVNVWVYDEFGHASVAFPHFEVQSP